MPSPIGHALAGIAVGTALFPGSVTVRRTAIFGALAMAPDLDLLVGAHSGPSHGVGVGVVVAALAFAAGRDSGLGTRLRAALAVAAAYGSHIVLDWLGSDTSPPIGVMALWPFSRAYYESSLHVFMAISRRYWLSEFWRHNLLAVGRELLILLPLVLLSLAMRKRKR